MRKGSKLTEEHKRKLSEAQLKRKEKYGFINSPEIRQKLRKAHIGRKHSEATRLKISKAQMGHKCSEETKKKLSRRCSEATKLKISAAKKGKHLSESTRLKIIKTLIGRKCSPETRLKMSAAQSGAKSHRWLSGKSFEPYTIDWTKTLRRSIRERDHYTCQLGGELQGDRAFPIHHIDYDKKNCNPSNLITLCRKCHAKTNNNREDWTKYFALKERRNHDSY